MVGGVVVPPFPDREQPEIPDIVRANPSAKPQRTEIRRFLRKNRPTPNSGERYNPAKVQFREAGIAPTCIVVVVTVTEKFPVVPFERFKVEGVIEQLEY